MAGAVCVRGALALQQGFCRMAAGVYIMGKVGKCHNVSVLMCSVAAGHKIVLC